MVLHLTPASHLEISCHHIPRHGLIPNTSIQHRPLLIYHSCFAAVTSASKIQNHLKAIGVVTPQWVYTMYSQSHFHSTTHEVLCILHGRALLCFGGEDNPGRVEATVSAGDVVIIPAGVAHRLLDDFNTGFQMVGSYPKDKVWDMCYGADGEEEKVKSIYELDWFEQDPLYGGGAGPILKQ